MSEIDKIQNPGEPTGEPKLLRLSKVAKEHNLSLSKIVNLLAKKNIHIESNPNAKISNIQYETFLSSLDEVDSEIKQKKQFLETYSLGTVIEVEISNIIKPSQIITYFVDGFIGRLSLMDISWCMPEGQDLFRNMVIGNKITCAIIEIDFQNKQVKLSQKHLNKQKSDSTYWERLDRGDVLTMDYVEELYSQTIIKSNKGIYGIINRNQYSLSNSTSIKVRINQKLDESDLISFVPASLELKEEVIPNKEIINDFGFIEPDLRDFKSFKKSIIGAHATDKDIEYLRDAFSNDDNLFSKEIEIPYTIYLSFELKSSSWETSFKQNAIPYFFDGAEYTSDNEKLLLEKLSNESYWVRFNKRHKGQDSKEEITEFTFFNEEISFYGEVAISKDKKELRYPIKGFTFGHNFLGSTEAKKRNSKYGSFLFRSKLKIVSPLGNIPINASQKEILQLILTKTHSFELINKLKREAGEILREEGRTLAIIDKFLEYQESLLIAVKGPNVFVEHFTPTHSEDGGTAILIDQSIGDSLELEISTVVNVKIKQGEGAEAELVWLTDGFLTYYGDQCKLTFYKEINSKNIKSGFYLEKRVSTKQFRVQRQIIQDFLQKKIKIDHIESLLVQPDKINPPTISQVQLINKDLVQTEIEQPDNNQIKALRKAIGNKNIFLIQGPPGTGKTTVIAEIIEQLVSKGEKILLTGQNHVAVDNVLAKISKIPQLNLLRVAKEDKIDKELGRFHVDNLITNYQDVFVQFLKNQLELIRLFLALKLKVSSPDVLLRSFNERINEYSDNYGTLKEILKHKHFILRDGLAELTIPEIEETITSFKNWIDSVNNETEILLKPLIYNSVDVVFATCIGIKTDPVFQETEIKFDTVIIDEAGKANIAETLVAIELGKKVILVGDQMQLPPYMDSSLIDPQDANSFPRTEYGSGFLQDEIIHALKTSFFEFLINRIKAKKFPDDNLEMLNYQHRMHPNIGKFVSESFYQGDLKMGSRTHLNHLAYPSPFNKEIVFFDTSNSPNPFEQNDVYSSKNDTEAEVISESILPKLFENELSPREIAIIAPYKSQVANIKKYISNSTLCKYKNIDVSTLDSFQGKEYDVILFSFTRSANFKKPEYIEGKRKSTKVGFLDDARRLNVAFSRARKKLILVGNAETLTDPRSHYDLLFDYTSLFRNLVRLSKREEIGNFVSIADFYDFKDPFDQFSGKYKAGDRVSAKFEKAGYIKEKLFGYFILCEGIRGLIPISLLDNESKKYLLAESVAGNSIDVIIETINKVGKKITFKLFQEDQFEKFTSKYKVRSRVIGVVDQLGVKNNKCYGIFFNVEGVKCLAPVSLIKGETKQRLSEIKPGEEFELIIENIEVASKRIAVRLLEKDVWLTAKDKILVGNLLNGKIIRQTNFGYFILLEIGIEALLHKSKNRKKTIYKIGDIDKFKIDSVDQIKKQISLSI
jgi:superfamily I DNA and/or RNA helicase/ribosomal protein S1